MMEQSCKNCWFYCHSNGKCYADPRSAYDEDYAMKVTIAKTCEEWAFDGLEECEREVHYEMAA